MQISCERCGTTYALDERLIPPGGAPVQCTRCGHVFTALPPGAAAPAAALPQLTSAPAHPGNAGSKTQMFGIPAEVASAAQAQPSPPAGGGYRASTQVFGSASLPPEIPPEPRTTQMFGSGPKVTQMFAGLSAPPPAPVPEPDRSKTQMFGRIQAPAPEPAPAPSPAPPPAAAPGISTTQVFGSLPPSLLGDAPPASMARTITAQQFAAVQPITAQPPEALDPLGFEDTVRRPIPQAPAKPAPRSRSSSLGVDASMATTQMFGTPDEEDLEKAWAARGGKAGFDRGAPTPLETPALRGGPEGAPTPVETPFRGLHGAHTPMEMPALGRIDLPPEPLTLGAEAGTSPDVDVEVEAAQLAVQLQRRNRRALLAVVGLLAVAAIGLGARTVLGRRRAVPADAQAQRESARLLVRRDDLGARQRAAEELTFLVARHPAYVAAHSDLVVALALQLDDSRLAIKHLSAEADRLNREIARLHEAQVPSDWQSRVNVGMDRLEELKRQSDPLVERVAALDARLNGAYRALEKLEVSGPEEQQALVRAQAVYFGVKGNDQAIMLAERYRVGGGTDGWGEVARAELALNTRVPPETVATALGSMERLTATDATFLRSYVLAARLALSQGRYEAAVTALESALALNPAHEVAKQLLEQARAAEQGAEAFPASP